MLAARRTPRGGFVVRASLLDDSLLPFRKSMARSLEHLLLVACLISAPPLAAADTALPGSQRSEQRLYRRAVECCSDPAQFSFNDTTLPGRLEFEIGPRNPLFEFQSGRSFFAALRLPGGESSYRIRIKSLLRGAGDDTRVFYPVVALLDDNFVVTRVSSVDHLRLEPALATPGGASGLALTVRIDPSIAVERYLVVFTPAVLLGAPPNERREGDVVTDPAIEYLERKADTAITPAAFGRILVSLVPDGSRSDADERSP
jgi:hypothetical protein